MQTSSGVELEIVLPVHNEAAVLERSVEEVHRYLSAYCTRSWSIVIAANGSSDGTDRLAQELAERYAGLRAFVMPASGRGGALLRVWSNSDASYSLYMDIDLSTRLEALEKALQLLDEGADMVAGTRLHRDSRTTRSLKREILSRGYNVLLRIAFPKTCVDDGQCGFKGIRLATMRPLLPEIVNKNWFFDTELLMLAEHRGLEVKMFPVEWIEDRQSSVRIASYVWENVKGLLRLRKSLRRKKPRGARQAHAQQQQS